MPPTSSVTLDTISAERFKTYQHQHAVYILKEPFLKFVQMYNFFLWVTRHGIALTCNFNVKVSIISVIYYPHTISILGVIVRGIFESSTILLRSKINLFRWSITAFLSSHSASY